MEKYQPADYRILTGRPSLHIPVPVEIYPQETFTCRYVLKCI
uniref:Uncharacterized protein n=1 Tax=Anguilla anguilla TaxID=7936 RepID=A0A0E9RYR4_ANGAN